MKHKIWFEEKKQVSKARNIYLTLAKYTNSL